MTFARASQLLLQDILRPGKGKTERARFAHRQARQVQEKAARGGDGGLEHQHFLQSVLRLNGSAGGCAPYGILA